jgi:hypothetical protein
MATEIQLKINADVKAAKKNIQDIKTETQSAVDGVGAFGITWGSVKGQFSKFKLIAVNGLKMVKAQAVLAGNGVKLMFGGKMRTGAKVFFNVVKSGIAATGIGLLLIAFASLVSYFTAGEKGAANFKKVTSAIGVVAGNVTDILGNFGSMLFNIATLDFSAAKKSFDDMASGVTSFYSETKKELKENNKLQNDGLKLQRFERKAIVDKAEAQKEMMRLRLAARDEENFSTKERIGFMQEATKIAEVQLEKDLHVAREKLRMKSQENALNVSSTEDLNEEARLKAAVFQVETANYSERKRMAMEEIALKNQAKSQDKAISDQKIADDKAVADAKKVIDDKADADLIVKQKRDKDSADMLRGLKFQNALAVVEDEIDAAYMSLENQKNLDLEKIQNMENAQELMLEIYDKYDMDIRKIDDASTEAKKARDLQTVAAAGQLAGALSSLAGDNKALAVASATIDTYVGATKAFAQGGPLGFISSAAVIAAGLGNVKKILSTDVGSGTGGGGSTPSITSSAPAPQFSSGSFELQGGKAQQPIEAYVVTDSMTDSQDRLSNIRRRATI